MPRQAKTRELSAFFHAQVKHHDGHFEFTKFLNNVLTTLEINIDGEGKRKDDRRYDERTVDDAPVKEFVCLIIFRYSNIKLSTLLYM